MTGPICSVRFGIFIYGSLLHVVEPQSVNGFVFWSQFGKLFLGFRSELRCAYFTAVKGISATVGLANLLDVASESSLDSFYSFFVVSDHFVLSFSF